MGEKFEAKWSISVDDVVCTFRYIYDQVGGSESPEVARSAGVAISNHQLLFLRNMLGDAARVEALYTRRITGDPVPAWWGNFNNQVGLSSGNPLHAQQCLLINLRNTEGLLKRSGRVFISGLADTWLVDGVWDAVGFGPTITNYLNRLIDIPAGGTDNWEGKLNVERNQVDGAELPNPIYVEVDAVDYTDTVGTQHRRKGELRGYQNPPGPP